MQKSKATNPRYSKFFLTFRPVFRYIYNFRCHACHTVDFHCEIHHIDKNRNNDDPFNLVPLCSDCHKLVHSAARLKFLQRSPVIVAKLNNMVEVRKEWLKKGLDL